MRYLMFVCVDPSAEAFDPAQDNIEEWVSSNDKKGTRIIGDRLAHISKAKTVRVRKGQLLITDGPFAETREWIGGFDLLDCGNIDEAIVRSRRSIQWPASGESRSDPYGSAIERGGQAPESRRPPEQAGPSEMGRSTSATLSDLEIQPDIQHRRGMGERTHRDHVDTRGGDFPDCREVDSS